MPRGTAGNGATAILMMLGLFLTAGGGVVMIRSATLGLAMLGAGIVLLVGVGWIVPRLRRRDGTR